MSDQQWIEAAQIEQIKPIVKNISDGISQAKDILKILAHLLNKEMADKLVPLVKKMKCQPLIKVAVSGLDKCLQIMVKIVDFLRQQSQQLVALSGVSLLFRPIVTSLDDLAKAASQELQKFGVPLPDVAESGQSLTNFTDKAGSFLSVFSNLIECLPEQAVCDEIAQSLKTIKGFSSNLSAQL